MYVNSNLVNNCLFLTTKDGITEWVAFVSQHFVACECYWVFVILVYICKKKFLKTEGLFIQCTEKKVLESQIYLRCVKLLHSLYDLQVTSLLRWFTSCVQKSCEL